MKAALSKYASEERACDMNGLFFNLEFSMSEAQDILSASATFFAGYSCPARTDHVKSMVDSTMDTSASKAGLGKVLVSPLPSYRCKGRCLPYSILKSISHQARTIYRNKQYHNWHKNYSLKKIWKSARVALKSRFKFHPNYSNNIKEKNETCTEIPI